MKRSRERVDVAASHSVTGRSDAVKDPNRRTIMCMHVFADSLNVKQTKD